MDTTNPRYRPEWATIFGWYLVIAGPLPVSVAVLEYVRFTATIGADADPFKILTGPFFWPALVACISVFAGIWILKRPLRTRLVLWALLAVSIISYAIGFYGFVRFAVAPGSGIPSIEIIVRVVGALSSELPLVAALVFLYSGRRRLYFAGKLGSLHCMACNYDLKGPVSVRCPECGTEY